MGRTETFVAGRILLTPHPAESYPGVRVIRPGPQWVLGLIVAEHGQSFVASGGERVYAYETAGSVRAQGFELYPGDRATRLCSDPPGFLAEWRIERGHAACSPVEPMQ